MTSIPGVDYAWARPGGRALQDAGKHFACRYLSNDAKKSISRAEADDLAAHGIWTAVVFEDASGRALSGHAAGVADAQLAHTEATAAGMPTGRPIFFAVDFDATPTQQMPINAYLDGAASILGRSSVGVYGGYYVVKRCLDAGKAHVAWQAEAWSAGHWDARAVLRQAGAVTINGASCDLDTATAVDYGQWMPGKLPTHPPASEPTVVLAHVVKAAKTDPGAPQGHTTYPNDVKPVEAALRLEGLLAAQYASDGSWGSTTITAYGNWQRRSGVSGPYDGIPGVASLTKLGQRHGFKVA